MGEEVLGEVKKCTPLPGGAPDLTPLRQQHFDHHPFNFLQPDAAHRVLLAFLLPGTLFVI